MAILFISESTAASTWTLRVPVMAAILLVTALIVSFSYYRSWKKLAHVPGPAAAHVSIFWLLRRVWKKELFPCMIEAGDKYGESVPFSLFYAFPYSNI